jgi:hypothetical protein
MAKWRTFIDTIPDLDHLLKDILKNIKYSIIRLG